MPTKRGWAALAAGVGTWIVARMIGSPDLHMLAAGLFALPFLAALYVHWSRTTLDVHRHLSAVRVFPGTRVTASLTVTNRGPGMTPFLLLEDALPPHLGKPARLVASGIPARRDQSISYAVACRTRGRYTVGPLSVFLTDPFGLARIRTEWPQTSDLIVYPEVEDVDVHGLAVQGAGTGESKVRQLFRSAAEFYTMRQYVVGDDLRRIHWASTARVGELMIRQDETARRSAATLFFDNRSLALGSSGSPGFERGVSVAASLGRALIRAGFAVRFGTVDAPPTLIGEERLLETLAGMSPTRQRSVSTALAGFRETALAESTLVFVTTPPTGADLDAVLRVGTRFGRKVGFLVYPVDPSTLSPSPAADLEGRAAAARSKLQHARWNVSLLLPHQRIEEVWKASPSLRRRPAAAWSF